MPGSTENTEGTASAVPSVASGDGAPLTRREARARREAQEKAAKAGTAEPGQQLQEAAAAVEPASSVQASPEPDEPVEAPPAPEPAAIAVPLNPAAAVAAPPAAQPKASRAGRNLPAAIAVGALMLGLVLAGLFWFEPLLVFLVVLISGVGCWEVARATTHAKTSVPMLPLFLASALMPISALWGGLEALGFTYLVSLLIALLFRLMEGLKGAAASVMSSVFIISWVPLLLSFALLILEGPRGQWMIATILLLAVSNDTFGYIVGVLFGKHPMAPKISPKKSWEGFAGSMLGSMLVGALAMHFWMDMPWWTGIILAFFTTIAATTGDFSESMVKRELGIKDMSSLLPGHGGIMDRLDSVLFVIPLGYLISHLLTWSLSLS
ncbi:hypothetical protein AUR04nite_23650 [Glutamicibacter uratoxydans]|uniref:Phosphatidate cytidylyltransferase n=1 Tax=Glutamicibacter uratoxydans TaxID=43667 RepID=A0A4Y4DQE7_GLUUR|nr:phosphatidate cytidylyltransferase [Glutamicibacter uratoxydans]GED06833.1 hypothetical protein AUR04nite_23650 [Glutamicibacter uratoxydans]